MIPRIGQGVYYKARPARGSVDEDGIDRYAIVLDTPRAGVAGNSCPVRLVVFKPGGMWFTDWVNQGNEIGDWNIISE